MQSPEFPELRFVQPRAWNTGRAAGQPTVVVIHSTEGSEGPTSAEDGAAYDQRRTDGTSTHFFADSNSVVQCVLTGDRANHARATGNKIGIGFELCGRAGQTSAQWHDANSLPMLKLAAKYVAKCCKKYGIPVRRLTIAQLRAGAKGIAGHVDITHAFGESTHTDPGPSFPWAEFLTMVQAELTPPKEDFMAALTDAQQQEMYAAVKRLTAVPAWAPAGYDRIRMLETLYYTQVLGNPGTETTWLAAQFRAVLDAVKAVPGIDQARVDQIEAELVAAVSRADGQAVADALRAGADAAEAGAGA